MQRSLIALVLASTLLLAAACSSDEATTTTGTTAGSSTTAEAPGPTGPSGTATPGTDAPAEEVVVEVWFVRDETVAPVEATASSPDTVARDAMEALLAGPSAQEADWGYGTAIPEGTALLGLDVADGIATVDLDATFESGGGSLSMQERVAQVVFTLTAFDSVDAVAFMIDGEPVTAIGGEGVIVDPPVTRDDFANVRPVIAVTSPLPGDEVSSPLTIEGESATFEGTVQVSVVDGDGVEVYQGFFTSATGANGVFGPFSETVTFEVGTPGLGAVILWEDDPSGESPSGRSFEIEIPVRIS